MCICVCIYAAGLNIKVHSYREVLVTRLSPDLIPDWSDDSYNCLCRSVRLAGAISALACLYAHSDCEGQRQLNARGETLIRHCIVKKKKKKNLV